MAERTPRTEAEPKPAAQGGAKKHKNMNARAAKAKQGSVAPVLPDPTRLTRFPSLLLPQNLSWHQAGAHAHKHTWQHCLH